MKDGAYKIALAVAAASLFATGCGEEVEAPEFEDVAVSAGEESSRLGIDSESKGFVDSLTSGSFYVVHNGVYYPLTNGTPSDALGSSSKVDRPSPDRQMYYTTDGMLDVPTFYPGDHLVFYSKDEFLDEIRWERFYDMGPTVGLLALKRSDSGRYYVDLDDDGVHTMPESELNALYDLEASKILVDKVGGVVIDDTVVQDGLILGATEGKTYDIEVYTGTIYKHFSSDANVRAFKSYELFASTEYETLQDCFWEVSVPEYMVSGYYNVNDAGLVRLCREATFDQSTDFNEQLLYPDPSTYNEGEYVAPALYSENEALNQFRTTSEENVGRLGYVDPEAEEASDGDEENDRIAEIAKLKEANVVNYDVWFPEGRECTITITSSTGETTGGARVTFENGTYVDLAYNRFDKVYEAVVNGKGEVGHLSISGFWDAYDIDMTNAQVYSGQDEGEPAEVQEPEPEPEAEAEPEPEQEQEALHDEGIADSVEDIFAGVGGEE